MNNISKIAATIRNSFATGKPCKVPVLSNRELGELLSLLDDNHKAAA